MPGRKQKTPAQKPREPRVKRVGSRNGLTVWLVDGSWVRANAHERKLRLQAGDLQKVKKGKSLPQPEAVHARLWKKLGNGVEVWFVNGRLVRSVYDIEFTEGR